MLESVLDGLCTIENSDFDHLNFDFGFRYTALESPLESSWPAWLQFLLDYEMRPHISLCLQITNDSDITHI